MYMLLIIQYYSVFITYKDDYNYIGIGLPRFRLGTGLLLGNDIEKQSYDNDLFRLENQNNAASL